MGVLSMDGTSNTAATNFACQKCGCACGSKAKEAAYSKYDRESRAFFDPIDNPYQAVDPSALGPLNQHFPPQQQLQQPRQPHPYQSPTPTTTSSAFQDFHHRHHHATTTANLDLQHQVESLKARLKQTSEHVEKLEHSLFEARQRNEQDAKKYQSECRSSRDKYERLLESHKQMQRVNQMLEDKVIAAAEKADTEGAKLLSAVVSLTTQMQSSAAHAKALEIVNEGLRRDCSVAVRLLQCRSSSFVSHRLDDLPAGLQDRVKANMAYEEIKRVEEARRNEGGRGGLWSLFTLPTSLSVSTFPPSAAFFDESNGVAGECGGDNVEGNDKDAHSVSIDMGDDGDEGALPPRNNGANISTSVLARVFDAAAAASASSAAPSSTGINPKNAASLSTLTPEQENLLKLYGGDPGSTSALKNPDVFPCSSSSSSCSDANEVNLQYYKCRRCRLQCVTSEKWTQTPLAPIYGGNGTPKEASAMEDEEAPAAFPIHLQGWKSGGAYFKSPPLFSSERFSLLPSSMNALPASSSTTAAAPPPRGQIPHANTFPDLGAFPDLVPSAELTTARRARMTSSSSTSSSSSRTIHSQTDGLAMMMDTRPLNFSYATTTTTMAATSATSFDALVAASTVPFEPFETERRRNDSESGSVYGGGWGDIHFADTTNSNVSQADVILDISNDAVSSGGNVLLSGAGIGATPQNASGQLVDPTFPSTTGLSTCLEEIALNDVA